MRIRDRGDKAARYRLALACAALLAGWLGCNGVTDQGGSGETHFLAYCADGTSCGDGLECVCGVCTERCDDDGSCRAHSDAATCQPSDCSAQRTCDVECGRDQDCAGLGAGYACDTGRCRRQTHGGGDAGHGGGGNSDAGHGGSDAGQGGGDSGVGKTCPAGCAVITAYPVDGCVGLPTDFTPPAWNVACECGDASVAYPGCHRRRSDGTVWYFGADRLADPSAWEDCNEEQNQAASFACDFNTCDRPPLSTCRPPDMCEVRDCGGLEYDENGCHRAGCQTDGNCTESERCVALPCVDSSACAYAATSGICQCGGPAICLSGNTCNPVSAVGPRGEWQRFEVHQGAGPCAPGESCTWTWTVTPDGRVDFDKNGMTGSAVLSDNDQMDLERLIDGPELRVALRDGIQCDGPPTDVGVDLRLVLPMQTLDREATGCAISGPEGNILQRVFQLVTAY